VTRGDPQFLDMTQEFGSWAVGQLPTLGIHNYIRNPLSPYTTYGLTVTGQSTIRHAAWAYRSIVCAAIASPAVSPDGSQLSQEMVVIAGNNSQWIADMLDLNGTSYNVYGGASSYIKTNGLFIPITPGDDTVTQMTPWQSAYFTTAALASAEALEDSNAKKWLQARITYYNYVLGKGGWHIPSYYEYTFSPSWAGNSNNALIADVISSDSLWSTMVDGVWNTSPQPVIVYHTTGPPYFTFTNGTSGNTNGYVPANGDKLVLQNANNADPTKPAELSTNTPYKFANVNNSGAAPVFDLQPWAGGASIVPSSTNTISPNVKVYLQSAVPPSAASGNVFAFNQLDAQGYSAYIFSDLEWMVAASIATNTGSGATDIKKVLDDLRTRLTAGAQYLSGLGLETSLISQPGLGRLRDDGGSARREERQAI
jgi:hypothetical protein